MVRRVDQVEFADHVILAIFPATMVAVAVVELFPMKRVLLTITLPDGFIGSASVALVLVVSSICTRALSPLVRGAGGVPDATLNFPFGFTGVKV